MMAFHSSNEVVSRIDGWIPMPAEATITSGDPNCASAWAMASLDHCRVGGVHRGGGGLASFRRDIGRDPGACSPASRSHDDRHAIDREARADRSPDPAAAPGHDGDPAGH